MQTFRPRARVLAVGLLVLIGCQSEVIVATRMPAEPLLAADGPGPTGGALVANSGNGQDDAVCLFASFVAISATVARTPSGNATLSCHFEDLAPIPQLDIQTGWLCTIVHGGTSETTQTQWIRATNGTADMTCQFSGKPTYNSVVTWNAGAAPAQEGNWTRSISELPGQNITAPVVAVGRACNADPLTGNPAGAIALIERGGCTFEEKVLNALAANAVAVIVYNSAAGGEQILVMSGVGPVPIPAVFVARSTGIALAAAAPTNVTVASCARSATCRGTL